jgi:SET domain-containing protein
MPLYDSPPRPAPSSSLARLIRIAETHVGLGVFARRRLEADFVLGEIHGEHLDDHPEDSSYVMELPSSRLLEPAPPLRFLNHSCDPNCEIFYWEADEGEVQEDRLWLTTIRPIEPGEQLLIDYGWPADAAIPCRCGAACCRGWICDPDELHLVEGREADGAGKPAAT